MVLYYTSKDKLRHSRKLEIKAKIDRSYTKMLYYKASRMTRHLKKNEFEVGKKQFKC